MIIIIKNREFNSSFSINLSINCHLFEAKGGTKFVSLSLQLTRHPFSLDAQSSDFVQGSGMREVRLATIQPSRSLFIPTCSGMVADTSSSMMGTIPGRFSTI
jgi:hypothetical protein